MFSPHWLERVRRWTNRLGKRGRRGCRLVRPQAYNGGRDGRTRYSLREQAPKAAQAHRVDAPTERILIKSRQKAIIGIVTADVPILGGSEE